MRKLNKKGLPENLFDAIENGRDAYQAHLQRMPGVPHSESVENYYIAMFVDQFFNDVEAQHNWELIKHGKIKELATQSFVASKKGSK